MYNGFLTQLSLSQLNSVMDRESQMEAILGPDSQPFEIFICHLMEKRLEAETMLRMIKQKDPNSFALKLAKSLASQLASALVPDNNWPQLLSILYGCFSTNSGSHRFQGLLPAMMDMLTGALEKKWEAFAQSELEILMIELAKNEPSFFRMQLVVVVSSMFDIAECQSYQKKTRHLAVEFVMTLVEAREKAPGMIKKYPLFTEKYFAILMNLLEDEVYDPLLMPDPDDAWENKGDLTFVRMCLLRLSSALGGKTLGPVAFEQLRANLNHNSWQKPCAALNALSRIVKGCPEVMIKNMKLVVTMVLECKGHPHPGVRYASMEAIHEFMCFMRPHFQQQCHHQVLPALTKAMDDDNVQVQVKAMTAVYDFICFRMPEYLTPYIHGIFIKLLQLSSHTVAVVQQSAASVLRVLPMHFKEFFGNNYKYAILLLENALEQANFPSNDLEFIKSSIKPYHPVTGKQIMESVISLQGSQEEGLSTISMLKFIGEFCQSTGKGFLPCTSVVIPLLFQCAQLELDITILSADSDHTYLDDDSSMNGHPTCSIHKVKLGDTTICINKISLEMKALACEVLGLLAYTLKEDFYPWIIQTGSILVPLLKFYFRNDIRINAVQAMQYLLQSALLQSAKLPGKKGIALCGNHSNSKQFLDSIMLNLVEALHEEPETNIHILLLDTLHVYLQICGPLLNEDQLSQIVDEIKHVITESSNRKGKLTEREKSEDFDDEEAILLRGEKVLEDQIFIRAGRILRILIETFKVAFLPYFDELSLYLIPMWGKEMTIVERGTSLYICDALVKECSEAALRYCDVFLPLFLKASNDEDPTVRQNALYGLGLYAEHNGFVFKPYVREAISRINVVIMHLRACEPENELAYDKAVSKLGKICQFHREHIDSVQVAMWLNCLPIKGDHDATKDVHGQLCSMVERPDREVLGPNYENLPKIMSIFAEVLCGGKHLATEETRKCMINLLKKLHKEVPSATFTSAWSLLLPKHKMELLSKFRSGFQFRLTRFQLTR